jgi:hypothetical protein
LSDPISPSAQTSASARTAWLIAANKPVYPVYVWYFAGSGFWPASLTGLTMPLYVGLALLLRRKVAAARLALPIVGLFDTILAAKLIGGASGAELFIFPCLMLATLAPEPGEARQSRLLVATIALAAAAAHGLYGRPLHVWDAEALDHLRSVNIVAVISLCAFLGWTFAERLRLSPED